MTIRRVGVSGLNFSQNKLLDEFWNIYREIFPIKLEKHYVELANLLFQYSVASNKLLEGDRVIEQTSRQLDDAETKREKATAEIDKMINYLNTLRNNMSTFNSEDFKKYLEHTAICTRSMQVLVKDNSLQEERNDKYDENRVKAGNAHIEIENLINKITNKLKEISRLSIDGKERLDRLVIEDRHLAKIDNNQSIPINMKSSVKELLKAYIDMQIATFRSSIYAAHQIINAYKSYEIIDYKNTNDPRTGNLDLIFQSLFTMEMDLIEKLLHCFTSTNLDQFHIQRNNSFVQMMQWYTSYFNGESKSIDITSIDEFTLNTSLNHYVNLEPLYKLRNIVFQEKTQNLNIEHYKR